MAKRNKEQKGKEKELKMPGKFKMETGGNIEDMEKKFKNSGIGDFLRVNKDDEFVIAILTQPTDWFRMQEHAISQAGGGWTYLPCTTKCPACARLPDNQARWYAFIPVYVYEYNKVQLYRAPSTVITKLTSAFKRYKAKGFLSRKWIMQRFDEGGPTTYEFDRQDGKVSAKVANASIPNIEKAMEGRWRNAIEQLNWNASGEDMDDDDEAFSHADDDDDVDIDDIKAMGKKDLIGVIEEYDLEIEDPEDIKTGALRKLIIRQMEDS